MQSRNCGRKRFYSAKSLSRSLTLGRKAFVGALIAQTCQQSCNRDVLVERIPVQAAAAQAHLFALPGRGPQQAGELGERNSNGSPIAQLHPHRVGIESNRFCANRRTHSMPSRCAPDSPPRFPRGGATRGHRSHHSKPLSPRVQPEFGLRTALLHVDMSWLTRRSFVRVKEEPEAIFHPDCRHGSILLRRPCAEMTCRGTLPAATLFPPQSEADHTPTAYDEETIARLERYPVPLSRVRKSSWSHHGSLRKFLSSYCLSFSRL